MVVHPLSTDELAVGVPEEPKTENMAIISPSRADVPTSEEAVDRSPFFHYRDHSQNEDPDPLCPLVPPGRVPT